MEFTIDMKELEEKINSIKKAKEAPVKLDQTFNSRVNTCHTKNVSKKELRKIRRQIAKEERGESTLSEIIRVIKRILKGDIYAKEPEFVRMYDAERDVLYMDKLYRPEELGIYEIEFEIKD